MFAWVRCERDSADYLPRNFRLSADRTTLTLRQVCKRSSDGIADFGCSQETDSGPMVMQCNASNTHGYVFANGYINVLGTKNCLRAAIGQRPWASRSQHTRASVTTQYNLVSA